MKAGGQHINQKGDVHNSDHSNVNISDLISAQKEEGELRDEEGSQ